MGLFSKKSDAEKAADELEWHRSEAKGCENMADTYSDLGLKKMSRSSAKAAEQHQQMGDELASEGRVRGWW